LAVRRFDGPAQHDDLSFLPADGSDRQLGIEIEDEPTIGADQAWRVVAEDDALFERAATARAMGVGPRAVVVEEIVRRAVHPDLSVAGARPFRRDPAARTGGGLL